MPSVECAQRFALSALLGLAAFAGHSHALEFSKVVAGWQHTCGITTEGDLYCWGEPAYGRLGVGESVGSVEPKPRRVDLTNVTAVALGDHHTCAVADARAYCWGSAMNGQLGNGEAVDQWTPIEVRGELLGRVDVSAVAATDSTSCAVAGGRPFCWGTDRGQLGAGDMEDHLLPVPVEIDDVDALDIGRQHACALRQGHVWCWGVRYIGIGGNSSLTPVPVQGLATGYPVERLSVGYVHSCAVSGGAAYCWGSGSNGRLGTGSTSEAEIATPVLWNHSAGVVEISAGHAHTCAIDSTGASWCWGSDGAGQLGDDLMLQEFWLPRPVWSPFGADTTALSAGDSHTCGVAGGQAFCWGVNERGQLGGDTDVALVPVPVPVNVDDLFGAGFEWK